MNNHEDPNIFPNMQLTHLTDEEAGSRLTSEELAMHNELVDELQKGVGDHDPKWEYYNNLHNKALGTETDQQLAA